VTVAFQHVEKHGKLLKILLLITLPAEVERPCEKKPGSEEHQQKSSEFNKEQRSTGLCEQEQELCEQDREESNRLCLVIEANISDISVRQSEDQQHRKKPCEFPDCTEDDISRKQGHKRWKRDNKLREQL
jgi:hypothetical protein